MAFLTETVQWEPGIYMISTSDPVSGASNDDGAGIANIQPVQLANRTAYLKAGLDDALSDISGLQGSYNALSTTVQGLSTNNDSLRTDVNNIMANRGLNGLEGELFFYSISM